MKIRTDQHLPISKRFEGVNVHVCDHLLHFNHSVLELKYHHMTALKPFSNICEVSPNCFQFCIALFRFCAILGATETKLRRGSKIPFELPRRTNLHVKFSCFYFS